MTRMRRKNEKREFIKKTKRKIEYIKNHNKKNQGSAWDRLSSRRPDRFQSIPVLFATHTHNV